MRSFRSKPVGWQHDNYRHYLAAKYGSAGGGMAYFARHPRTSRGKGDSMYGYMIGSEMRSVGNFGDVRSLRDAIKDDVLPDSTKLKVLKDEKRALDPFDPKYPEQLRAVNKRIAFSIKETNERSEEMEEALERYYEADEDDEAREDPLPVSLERRVKLTQSEKQDLNPFDPKYPEKLRAINNRIANARSELKKDLERRDEDEGQG